MANKYHGETPVTPAPEKDKMVDFVVEQFNKYEAFHRERFDEAWKIYDQWIGKPPARDNDWQNAVHVPITFEAEQTITPRIFGALFPDDAPLDVKVEGDVEVQAGIPIKNTIQHYFRLSGVQVSAMSTLTQNTLFGTSYVEASWLVQRQWMQDNTTLETYSALTANRPDCKFVSFFEIYPHPAKIEVTDPLPLVRRRFADAEYLKSLMDNPRFDTSSLKEALQTQSVVWDQSSIQGNDGRAMMLEKKDSYEILEYWGPWDESYTKNGQVVTRKAVPYWIIVINRKVKIRGIRNPYNHQRAPFCKTKFYTDAKPSWFGIGIGKVGKPTQERLNKLVNQRLDNVDLVLNKQGVYNGNDPLINVRKLQFSKPGQWHKVSDVNASLKWMEMPDVTGSSYNEETLAKQDFREATGATQVLMPAEGAQHRTYSGLNLLQSNAGLRFGPVLRMLEVALIQDLAVMYLSMLQQFMSQPEWIKVINEDGSESQIQIFPEDIQAKVYFIPTGVSELMNKDFQVSQLMKFKEMTKEDPTINRREINKRIAELMGFKDVNKMIVEQQPINIQPGGLSPIEQEKLQQRIAEGASPEQIKAEFLGQPPMTPEQQQGIPPQMPQEAEMMAGGGQGV